MFAKHQSIPFGDKRLFSAIVRRDYQRIQHPEFMKNPREKVPIHRGLGHPLVEGKGAPQEGNRLSAPMYTYLNSGDLPSCDNAFFMWPVCC